ncbi:MAG: hypothetical protein WDZ64_00780 [Parcubacteria group bacterium]
MRFRIALALSLSIILVVMASWNRFAVAEKSATGISLVENTPTSEEVYSELLRTYTETSTTTTSSETKPLSGTDLIGRQLIMDYVDLASNGQATKANLNLLAIKYAESVPTLISAPKIGYFDIKTVANSAENIKNYADQLGVLYDSHSRRITAIFSGETYVSTEDQIIFPFAQQAVTAYEDISSQLRDLPTPLALALSHVDLINNHLASVAAMKSLSEAGDDPMLGMAGLITFNENMDKEIIILQEMDKIFKTNAI